MRIERSHRHERFGAVRIHETTQVIELDSGSAGAGEAFGDEDDLVRAEALNAAESRMAIVVPTKGERRKVIEGVLSGIPHDCLIILVSASERQPVDRYAIEIELLERFCRVAQRSAVAVHQDDPAVGAALADAGLGAMVEHGIMRRGKGEAMIVGMLLAAMADKEHVGFIDADNYVPGAVHEYVKVFAASLYLAPTPYAMVRISWQSKPKIEDGRFVFNRWGRTTQVTNRFLNLVLSTYNGFGTEVIRTGNAGEHAMTMALAKRLRFAGGYAVEPYEYIDVFEQFGGALPSPHPEAIAAGVDVYQVETRNPHFHEDKGTKHTDEMRFEALAALLQSPICPEPVRTEILELLESEGQQDLARSPVYQPWGNADLAVFGEHIRRAPTWTSIPKD